jgi:hypothetical protein
VKYFEGWPEPPENVEAITRDGDVVPLECVYSGEHAGRHYWEAVLSLGAVPAQIRARRMPANTTISVLVRGQHYYGCVTENTLTDTQGRAPEDEERHLLRLTAVLVAGSALLMVMIIFAIVEVIRLAV